MLNKARFFFKYMFRFRPPEIEQLNYVDYVIINKSYLLISWRSKYAYKVSIKAIYSTYYRGAGSAYVLIPSEVDSVEVAISNLWYSKKFQIPIIKTEIGVPFEFELVPNFKDWQSVRLHLPQARISSKKLVAYNASPKLRKPVITVQNLSFLKP